MKAVVYNMVAEIWILGILGPKVREKGVKSQVKVDEIANKLLNIQEFAFTSLPRVNHCFLCVYPN